MVEAGGERGHRQPAAGVGFTPSGQPFAVAIRTVGISVCSGSGNRGFGPTLALGGSVACSPQPDSPTINGSHRHRVCNLAISALPERGAEQQYERHHRQRGVADHETDRQ